MPRRSWVGHAGSRGVAGVPDDGVEVVAAVPVDDHRLANPGPPLTRYDHRGPVGAISQTTIVYRRLAVRNTATSCAAFRTLFHLFAAMYGRTDILSRALPLALRDREDRGHRGERNLSGSLGARKACASSRVALDAVAFRADDPARGCRSPGPTSGPKPPRRTVGGAAWTRDT